MLSKLKAWNFLIVLLFFFKLGFLGFYFLSYITMSGLKLMILK